MNRKSKAEQKRHALFEEYRKVMLLAVTEQEDAGEKLDLVEAYAQLVAHVNRKSDHKPQEKALYKECLRTFTQTLSDRLKEEKRVVDDTLAEVEKENAQHGTAHNETEVAAV